MSKLNELMRRHGMELSAFGGNTKAAVATLEAIKKGQASKPETRHKKPNQPR